MVLPIERPKCSHCGAPAIIGTGLDTEQPDWRCVQHMARSAVMRAVKLARLAAGQRLNCIVCGKRGHVPVIYEWRLVYFCHAHCGEDSQRADVIGG